MGPLGLETKRKQHLQMSEVQRGQKQQETEQLSPDSSDSIQRRVHSSSSKHHRFWTSGLDVTQFVPLSEPRNPNKVRQNSSQKTTY